MATAEPTLSPGGKPGRHRRYGLNLPAAPSDAEKASYADRNSGADPPHFSRQFRRAANQPDPLHRLRAGAAGVRAVHRFTLAYYLISLCVNVGTRRLRRGRAPPPGGGVATAAVPLPGRIPSGVRGADRGPPQHLGARRRVAAGLPGWAPPTCSTTARRSGAGHGQRLRLHPPGPAKPGLDEKGRKPAARLRQLVGEFILILDADFAPRADLPAEMLPYLIADPRLGIVQSPQYFRTGARMSWIERGAGAVQELFYRLMQVSRDRHDGAICVGSCAIYRREALAANGGTTLIEHSEDVHTGFDLRRAGWGLRYIPVPLAAGLCPSDPGSFLIQQYRWCAGPCRCSAPGNSGRPGCGCGPAAATYRGSATTCILLFSPSSRR